MANNLIQLKRTSVSGRAANSTTLQYPGELALNMADGILYSTNGSVIFEVGANNTNAQVTGNLNVKAIIANGSLGTAGQVLTSNSSGLYWSTAAASVNTAAQYTWTNTQTFANSITINNDKRLFFQTVNSAAYAAFVQQSDDNFVFYTTNTSYGTRAVYSIYANSNSSEFSFQTPVRFNSNVTVLVANGTQGSAGQVLTTNGGGVYWSTPAGGSFSNGVSYTWSTTQTFQANVSFTGNGIGISTNTGAIYFAGVADANWKIGRNTNATTKWRYSNNTLDILAANSNLEGVVIGNPLVGGATYFETGHLGTYISSNVTIGNTTSNVTINSTSFSGTANNASYLGGNTASDLRTYSDNKAANAYSNATSYADNKAANAYSNATSFASNASNISTGTLAYARLGTNVVNTSANFTITGVYTHNGNVVFNGSIVDATGNTGTAGQILTTNGANTYWSSKYTVGSLPPDYPNYGDTWYYTDMEKLFMWINDGGSDYWYDFLPPAA